jgi:hypothetical protein
MRTALPALLVLALACGDDASEPANERDASTRDADTDIESDASVHDGGDGDGLRDAVGTFSIELIAPADDDPGITAIFGRVYAAMPASTLQWTLADEAGDCQLYEPLVPFCDPSCGSGTICLPDGTCAAPPASLDVGTVSFGGLGTGDGEATIELEPLPPTNTYQPRSTSELAFPPFEEGDTITVRASGGDLTAFELSAGGIAPLEVLSPSPIQFDPEAATVVSWTAPERDASSQVIITVDISHHGGRKGELVCTTDDDGEHELPAELVQGLIELGVAGFPTVTITRESKNDPSAEAPGLTLRVFSEVDRNLEIPGVVSCEETGQQDVCPEGQTCQANKICR